MATRSKARTYKELGNYLSAWREERFRSALALFREAKFSFSYSTYADIERGIILPSPEVIVELARFFKKDPKPAILLWAKSQMPSAELRALFSRKENAANELQDEPRPDSAAAPSFENTWTFGPREKQMLEAHPRLWELCLSLVMHFPDEVPWCETYREIEKHITPWLESGYLLRSKTGLKLKYQHLHLPRTQEWEEIRKANLERALGDLLQTITPDVLSKEKGYRELIHRPLHGEQAVQWVKRLKQLEAEFKSDAYSAEASDSPTYALAIALGPRPLRKKS